jgi:hypothetical protein
MATDKRQIIDDEQMSSREYFIRNDNLNSVHTELSFSILRRYNCFAGCKICYIDKNFEKDKEKFSRFIPTEIPKEIEDSWDTIFKHYRIVSTIDDLYWIKHKQPDLYTWYTNNAYRFHFGTLTDNSFVRNYDIFMNELISYKTFPEITFSDAFLVKVNIEEILNKLNVIQKRFGIKLMKLVQTNLNSHEWEPVKKFIDWSKTNAEEFSIHYDFTKFDTLDTGQKDQETVFATFNSELYNLCGEIDYLQYDSFFLTLPESTDITSTPYHTIEDGFNPKKHLSDHLKGKITLYAKYAEKLKYSINKNKQFYGYFKWVSENLIVNDDYTYIPILSLKNFHPYYEQLQQNGWTSSNAGLLQTGAKYVKPIFNFKS